MQFIRVDINCQRKWITAPLTEVLELSERACLQALPTPDLCANCPFRTNIELFQPLAYMHFGNRGYHSRPTFGTGFTAPLDSQRGSCGLPRVLQRKELRKYYDALCRAWGPQHWWPAESRFEVVVGAYLTQNTAWTSVERALANLRDGGILTLDGIRCVSLSKLQRLIRPSGYFRQKAARLKTFVRFLDKQYGGSLDKLFSEPTDKLRSILLDLNGIGPETADSILLYAGNHPVFVVDAYTRRILSRHDIVGERTDYEEIRQLVQTALAPVAQDQESHPLQLAPPLIPLRGAAHSPSAMSTAHRTALVQVYNEMHGLIVGVGKNHCGKSKPKCDDCPLRNFLPQGK